MSDDVFIEIAILEVDVSLKWIPANQNLGQALSLQKEKAGIWLA